MLISLLSFFVFALYMTVIIHHPPSPPLSFFLLATTQSKMLNPSTHPSIHPFHQSIPALLSDPNDAASRTTARVARRLALLVPALAEVVGARVHDDGAAEDALGPDELDLAVRQGPLGVALRVRLEVAEVADVAFCVRGGAVRFAEWVDCGMVRMRWRKNGRGANLLTVRSGARAAVGVVAELVDVHAPVGGGVVAGDVVGDGRRGGFGRLLKGDGPADFGVTAEDCDCCGEKKKGFMLVSGWTYCGTGDGVG